MYLCFKISFKYSGYLEREKLSGRGIVSCKIAKFLQQINLKRRWLDFCTCVCFATVISACCSVPLSWEELAVTGLARNRWFGGSAFFNGRLFIFGGQGNRQGTNDTGVLGEHQHCYLLT